jgi:hypothetical protein
MRLQIEFPSVGTTYACNKYAVYEYSLHPRSSVLKRPWPRRVFYDDFDTIEVAQAAYPRATVLISEPVTTECY